MKNQEMEWLLSEKYQNIKSAASEADCARLAAGEPLGYVIGHVPFLDCTIHLDSHPLIPRPETEYWVEQAIKSIQTQSSGQDLEQVRGETSYLHMLDLCAGSGAIGVAVAQAIPEAIVTFAELDPTHLPTIQKNISENTTIYDSNKYEVIEIYLFENVPGIFDFILTNPPYIDKAADTVDASVTAHEPHLALFGGVDGMEIISRIITEAPKHLTKDGQLWIEHEPFQSDAIHALGMHHTFTVVTHPDQYGTPRVSVLTMAQ